MEDLWRIRQQKRLSISEISSKSGVPARRIQEYEAGERAITSSDLTRLARALYVEEWEIKLESDPAPKPKRSKPQVGATEEGPRQKEAPAKPRKPPESPQRRPPARKQPAPQPARESQVEHMRQLGVKLGLDDAALAEKAGKPLAELTRQDAAKVLYGLQAALREAAPGELRGKRKRPYLPESVDAFEFQYLTTCQEEGSLLTFVLFNGEQVEGKVMGFSPYTITVQSSSGDAETTLRKLAIAYYRRLGEDDREEG